MPSLDSSSSQPSISNLELTIKNLKDEIEKRKMEKEKLAGRYDENMVLLLEEIDELKVKNRALEQTVKIQEEVADSLKTKLIQAEDKIHKLKRAFVLVDNCNQGHDEPPDTPINDKNEPKEQIEETKPVVEDVTTPETDKNKKKTAENEQSSHDSLYNLILLLIHLVTFLIHCKIAFQ